MVFGLIRRVFTTPQGLAGLAGLGVCGAGALSYRTTSRDFFKHSFKTKKDPDAIVDFYSTEDFLQIIGVFPMAIHFVLSGVEWDNARENTMGVHNMMTISFDITEKEENIDGKDVVTFFNKRERFVNYIPFTKVLLWDQVQNYGYQRHRDGTIEITHSGEEFFGPPIVAELVKLHARYVAWATEKHINSPIFGTEDLEKQEEQRGNIPLHVFKEFVDTLGKKQEEKVNTLKLQRKSSVREEATLQKLDKLKTLRRADTTISVTKGGAVKIHVKDPQARDAIRAAMADLGADQAVTAEALQQLKGHKDVKWTSRLNPFKKAEAAEAK